MANRSRLLLYTTLLVAVVLLVASAEAGMRGPIGLRMDVRVDSDDAKLGTPVVLRVGKRDRRCVVTHTTVVMGNVLAADVFDRRRPYKPTFTLRGPKDLLAKFDGAPAGTDLRIVGNWPRGASDFLVGAVGPVGD